LTKGGAIYEKLRLPCHGQTRQGDGAAGQESLAASWQPRLALPDAHGPLGPVHVLDHRRGRRCVRNGDAAFKSTLAENDIWALIANIQARLPERSK
jgi:mono/diheme cytochrome c family protein